jgi:transketolase
MPNTCLIKKIVELSYKRKEGHLGSSLSILDLLYVLYKNFLPLKTNTNENDFNRLILSKGHASLGLYAVLDYFNLLEEDINNFCLFDSKLGGHPSDQLNAVEASTGSLGHGLPIGVGMAIGYKIIQNIKSRIYVIIGDGEMNEGSIWEALLLASNHKLNNLTCILDYNRSNDRALKLDNIQLKVEAFNWHCLQIDGHNHRDIQQSLSVKHSCKPTFIIANTIKGKGISFMENNPEWHHKAPNEEEYFKILNDLDN